MPKPIANTNQHVKQIKQCVFHLRLDERSPGDVGLSERWERQRDCPGAAHPDTAWHCFWRDYFERLIILMDLEMPVVDGWEATRRLKGNPQTRDIPIIALSAHALAGEREKALAAGCNEFDTKPIEFDRLVATLRRILANRK